MATYQDFSLIKQEIEFVKKRNNIDSVSNAFIFAMLEKLYPEVDPEECITDGGRDFCVDAYYIDESEKEINIFQFKYTENFETSRNKEGLGDRDMNDLILKIERIWNKDNTILREANKIVSEAVREIWGAFDRGFLKTNVWLITNYHHTIADRAKLENVTKTLKEKFRAKLKIFSLDDIADLSIQKEFEPVDIQLQLKGRNYFEDSAGNVRALIGEINALNFIKSLMNSKDELREEVFNENVRVYLRSHTKINKQIYSSIESEENYKFFFYNNGITAICDSFNHLNTDGPTVTLKNFQIVNGGQTMHSIQEAYKNGLIENILNIYLLLRIYEVKDREIGQAIARYTNTQNPVRSRDIMSNDLVQVKLQKNLETLDWWYERKRYEYRDRQALNERKIDAEKLGQVILAFYLEKPGSAKNKKQEIFGNFYNDIFSEERVDIDYVLPPYLLFKKIENDVKNFSKNIKMLERDGNREELARVLQNDEFLPHAHYYLLFTLKLLAEKNSIEIGEKRVEEIFGLYNEAKRVIREILEEERAKSSFFSIPRLFKTDDMVDKIKQKI